MDEQTGVVNDQKSTVRRERWTRNAAWNGSHAMRAGCDRGFQGCSWMDREYSGVRDFRHADSTRRVTNEWPIAGGVVFLYIVES